METLVNIIETPIDVGHFTHWVLDDEAGAVSTFIGTTRRTSGTLRVASLFYEAYKTMAQQEMHILCDTIRSKHDVLNIAMIHRLGWVKLKEISILIAISAPHRKPAIDACEYAINQFKLFVPIWKQEITEDGEKIWIGNNSPITT